MYDHELVNQTRLSKTFVQRMLLLRQIAQINVYYSILYQKKMYTSI